MALEVPKRSAQPSGWRNRGRKHWCSLCTTHQGEREGEERAVLQEWAQSCSQMWSGGMEPPLGGWGWRPFTVCNETREEWKGRRQMGSRGNIS